MAVPAAGEEADVAVVAAADRRSCRLHVGGGLAVPRVLVIGPDGGYGHQQAEEGDRLQPVTWREVTSGL